MLQKCKEEKGVAGVTVELTAFPAMPASKVSPLSETAEAVAMRAAAKICCIMLKIRVSS